MQHDSHGLEISTDSDAAARAFDHTVAGYIGYRADTGQRLPAPLLAADPQFALAHCSPRYLMMLTYKQAKRFVCGGIVAGSAALVRQRDAAREQAHIAALAAWIDGEPDRASALWQQILATHPRDVLAFRLAYFTDFLAGPAGPHAHRGTCGRASLERRTAALRDAARLPPSQAHEECGLYTEAEAAGQPASRTTPPMWATRRGACDGDAGPLAPRASPGPYQACAATGTAPTTCATICGGTPRCFTWNEPRPIRSWRFTTRNSVISPRR